MSFGGFFGSSSGDGSGDARIVGNSPYNYMPTAQPQHALSLTLKPKMEGLGEMGLMGGNSEVNVMGRIREDGYESRSGSDNLEGASVDDQDTTGNNSRRKRKYYRHTPHQIQDLESSFKENPHPDEKERLEIGRRLGLETRQVKFWFQNRRTQMKTQLERHDNLILKQENDGLRIENIAIKEAIRNPICNTCGGPAILGEVSAEGHQVRIENARLKDELNRICILANRYLGRSFSSFGGPTPPPMSNSSLELVVGRNGANGFGLGTMNAPLPMGCDLGNGVGMTGTEGKSMFLELALTAMDELLKLAQIDNHPLWFRSLYGEVETLNHEEYMRTFPPCIGMKPSGFITEATRANGTIIVNSLALVDMLMNPNWGEMFPGMIGRTSTVDVISSGMGGTRNGALHLMSADIQVISPLVPVRQVKFLRFCKQHAEGIWAVVDVSVDAVREGSNAHNILYYRRLPSGFILQELPNGYCKVTWVEHWEYDETAIHNLYLPFLRSGMGFGAQKWLSALQRQCECLLAIASPTISSEDHSVITPSGRKSIAKLAQRMTRNFCAGVCATLHQWEVVQVGNLGGDLRLTMRRSCNNPGEPSGIVLSATMSVWMPVLHQRLFDLLQNEQLRNKWDVLSHGGPIQQMIRIAKGHDHGNNISLLRAIATADNGIENNMLILQETTSDSTGSLIAYGAVDVPGMTLVMKGGDSDCVSFLPSGFSIVPDCFPDAGGVGGSLLTLGFQMLLNSLPSDKLTMESVVTVKTLMSRTIQGIREALNCN